MIKDSYIETLKDLNMEFIFVEHGHFKMGCQKNFRKECEQNEKPQHEVLISSDYYVGKYPVTQGQWKKIMGNNPSSFSDLPNSDNRPVNCVSWVDAKRFIRELNKNSQYEYRLPTEAEWEFAARGGLKSQEFNYSGSNNPNEVGWNDSNTERIDNQKPAQEVGKKIPNELGIYDMSGNVWEWCEDWYGKYNASYVTDPKGPYSGTRRVFRGGAYDELASTTRVTLRSSHSPDNGLNSIGFRLVRTY